jgi:hypothetical protein
LEKGLQKIYGFEGKITSENWETLSLLISEKHSDPQAHISILRDVAKYRHAVQDSFWDYGSDNGHPDLFSPTMRTDMFVSSFHPEIRDHDGNSPFSHYADAPTSNFEDYLDFLKDVFTSWRNLGAVAMKSAIAYERSLNFDVASLQDARRVFGKTPQVVTPQERRSYEDYMFNWFCELAIELEVPYQVHTGSGLLAGSNPLLFEPVIMRYPRLHFVLFHAGYPWYNVTAGLAHNHPNISLDMSWAPLISTTGAILALHQFIEIAQSNQRIAWGSDTSSSEEAYGALLAWRHVMAKVLSEKVEDDYFDISEAEVLAHNLMYGNASNLYDIGVGD